MASHHESTGIYAADGAITITIDDEPATRPVWEWKSRVRDGEEIDYFECESAPCVRIQVWWTDGGWRYWIVGGYGPLTQSQRAMFQRALAGHGLPEVE